jgi:Ring finger domain
MEGRCGQPTASGAPCKNRGTPCHLHRTDNQCSVCFTNMAAHGTRTLSCGHIFHSRCVERWKNTCTGLPTCPMCRTPFDVPQYKCVISIQRVSDGVTARQDLPLDDMERLVRGLGLELRQLTNEDLRMNVDFDVQPGEDIHDVLRDLGILHFILPDVFSLQPPSSS